MAQKQKDTVYFYGIPAYGHTLSNLYLAGRLAEAGFRVIYYSVEPFQKVIEENGCEYRPYSINWENLDLRDGERILKLYRLILQYTWELLPELLRQAGKERPRAILFESLALWGRAVGELVSVPTFAFYSIAAIDWTWRRPGGKGTSGILPVCPWKKGLSEYVPGFSGGFLRYGKELPGAMSYVRRLRVKYGLKRLGLMPVLMNRGDYNLCGYSRLFQPGGRWFGAEYRFTGPLSVHRRTVEHNDFSCLACTSGELLIYISLGTIFNENEALLQEVIRQFGRDSGKITDSCKRRDSDNRRIPGGRGNPGRQGNIGAAGDFCEGRDFGVDEKPEKEPFRVVLVWEGNRRFPENFIVRPFVNQNEILRHADLFITAGGVNSIHEALYFGVPCLLCPQQGEQLLNGRQFQRLGFGRILRNPAKMWQEAMECMQLRKTWTEKRRAAMTAVSLREVLEIFEELHEKPES
nr:glycosyltransferase [uncultured Acetatifactor sp.]